MSVVNVTEERRAFFTPKTLAVFLAVSERTVYELLSSGQLASYKVAGARRIDPADVDEYLARNRQSSRR